MAVFEVKTSPTKPPATAPTAAPTPGIGMSACPTTAPAAVAPIFTPAFTADFAPSALLPAAKLRYALIPSGTPARSAPAGPAMRPPLAATPPTDAHGTLLATRARGAASLLTAAAPPTLPTTRPIAGAIFATPRVTA